MPALFFFAIVPSTLWGRPSKAVRFPTHVPHNEFLPCLNLLFHSAKIPYVATRGRVAQLGERIVRNDEVAGSIPVSSTKSCHSRLKVFHFHQLHPNPPFPQTKGLEMITFPICCPS